MTHSQFYCTFWLCTSVKITTVSKRDEKSNVYSKTEITESNNRYIVRLYSVSQLIKLDCKTVEPDAYRQKLRLILLFQKT